MQKRTPQGSAGSPQPARKVPRAAEVSSDAADVQDLYAAIHSGSVEAVRAILTSNRELFNEVDGFGGTALHTAAAAEHCNVELVELLLEHGVDVSNRVNCVRQTALHVAVRYDNVELVKLLLQHGFDVNKADGYGDTALHVAVESGNVELVELLLQHGVDVSNRVTCLGQTALHVAVRYGKFELVKLLLQHGFDVNKADECGQTALHLAVKSGKVELVKLLLQHGFDVNKADEYGQTALHLAVKSGKVELVKLLLQHGFDVNKADEYGQIALHLAVKSGKVELVKLFLQRGFDVNKADEYGQTALHLAVKSGKVELVKLLLQHGFDVNRADEYGQTALHLAVESGKVELVKLLLQHGFDVNRADEYGQTALHLAVESGKVELVKLLLQHGFDVNRADELGRTALHVAVESGNADVVEQLLLYSPDVNKADRFWGTTLHKAEASGHIHFANELPSNHVIDNIELEGNTGRTALFATFDAGLQTSLDKIVELLLNHGADFKVSDCEGTNVLFYAIDKSFRNLSLACSLELLLDKGISIDVMNHLGENLLLSYLHKAKEETHSLSHWDFSCCLEVCKLLLDKGVDVAGRDRDGYTAVHLCILIMVRSISHGKTYLLDLLRVILSKSAALSKRLVRSWDDTGGDTPLHLWASFPCSPQQLGSAEKESYLNLAKLLLDHGAQVNSTNGKGESPLHVAQNWSAAKFLFHHGASVKATDSLDNTPLLRHVKQLHILDKLYEDMPPHLNLRGQWKEILRLGFDPWKGDGDGTTILSVLLQKGDVDAVRAFLEATGAPYTDGWPVDSNGDTPLHVICRDGAKHNLWKVSLIESLVNQDQRTTFVNCLNRKGQTVLNIVCQTVCVSADSDDFSSGLIEMLRYFGAEVKVGEGQDCCELAADNEMLLGKLTKDLSNLEPWLRWFSQSAKHHQLLAQVARGQNSWKFSNIHCHNEAIGSGAFGSVFVGITVKDGREVAVKRFEKTKIGGKQHKREVRNLVNLSNCENVVRYLSFDYDQHFFYIILELMEGNLITLTEILHDEGCDKDLVPLCKDLLSGLKFLHQNHIIHRDIKPGNILYKRNPKGDLTLKLADFGLSSKAPGESAGQSSTVMHRSAGTLYWMAPELLGGTMQHSTASDNFSCGLVVHYILSLGKHPFGSNNIDILVNISKNHLMIDNDLLAEAKHLISMMVLGVPDKRSSADEHLSAEKRLSAAEALEHPVFWPLGKKYKFIEAVANIVEHQQCGDPETHFPSVLEQDVGSQFTRTPWKGKIPKDFFEHMEEYRLYNPKSVVDLLRFMRNTYQHCAEQKRKFRRELIPNYHFIEWFPNLCIDVYRVVMKCKPHKMEAVYAVMKE